MTGQDERVELVERIERHLKDAAAAAEGHVFDLYPDEQLLVLAALRSTPVGLSEEERRKELGHRSRDELAALFGKMYAGWDRGVNVTQERFGDGETRFTETPMTPLELEARYVAAEIGVNIYEIANRAAFAPIIVYSQIQAHLGPLFDRLFSQREGGGVPAGWQAIETAPKVACAAEFYYGDVVWRDERGAVVTMPAYREDSERREFGYWDGAAWHYSGSGHRVFEFLDTPAEHLPTHWRYVAAPPGAMLSASPAPAPPAQDRPYLQIGGVTSSDFGNTDALRVRVGTDNKWEWRKVSPAEYAAMLGALNVSASPAPPEGTEESKRRTTPRLSGLEADWDAEEAAPPEGVGEIVGWMARCPSTGGSLFAHNEQRARALGAEACAPAPFDVLPLYAATPAPSPMVTEEEIARIKAFLDKAHEVLIRRFPRCRDCADDGPTCPQSGLPCDLDKEFRAILSHLRQSAEPYSRMGEVNG